MAIDGQLIAALCVIVLNRTHRAAPSCLLESG